MSIQEDIQQLKSDMKLNPIDYHERKRFRRDTITLTVIGEKGSGKTLFMCILAFIYNLMKKEFYTNFSMHEGITYRRPFNLKGLYNNPHVEALFLDEMHNIADQNSNQTLETQLLVALFTQSRKRNQLIVMSSLYFYKIAKDLRFLTNIIVLPEYNEEEDYLDLLFWNFRNNYTTTKRWYNVSCFFKYYDSFETVISQKTKHQLTQFLLKHEKVKKEIKKELSIDDIALLETLEEKMKNDRK